MFPSEETALDDPFAELLRRIRPHCFALFHRFQLPPEDAEDVLQTTLVLLLTRFDTVRNPEAWILGTLRNRCLMHLRARGRRSEPLFVDSDVLDTLAPLHPSHETPLHARLDLEPLVNQLPPSDRWVLRLLVLHGWSSKELAHRFGWRRQTVRRKARRARTRLRELFRRARRGPLSTPPTDELR